MREIERNQGKLHRCIISVLSYLKVQAMTMSRLVFSCRHDVCSIHPTRIEKRVCSGCLLEVSVTISCFL